LSAYFANDGSLDYISVDKSYKWDFEDNVPWTVDVWFNMEVMSTGENEMNTIMYGSADGNDYAIGIGSDQVDQTVVFALPDGEGGTDIHLFRMVGVGMGAGTWHHFAAVDDGEGSLRVYIDGEQLYYYGISGEELEPPIEAMPIGYVDFGDFVLAATGDPQYDFHGWMDDFRISNSMRWSGESFDVPEAEAEIDDWTVFLLDTDGADGATNFSSTTLDEILYTLWDENGNIIEDADVDKDYYSEFAYSESQYLIYKETTTLSTGYLKGEWYFDTEDNYLWKFNDESDNTAGIYFEVEGFKLETYWAEDGTISHWNSSEDYDESLEGWIIDGSFLEVYSYWLNGNTKYKDIYTWNIDMSSWDYSQTGSWLENGDWVDWLSEAQNPEPIIPDKPEIGVYNEAPTKSLMDSGVMDEVLSKNDAEMQNNQDFTGYSPEVEGSNLLDVN